MAGNLIPSSDSDALQPAPFSPASALGPAGEYAPMPALETDDGVQWGRYLEAIKRYKWMILSIILLGTVLGVVVARFVRPEYEVRATVFVQPQPSESGPVRPSPILASTAWVELLTTFDILDKVVHEEQLYLSASPADSLAFREFGLGGSMVPGTYTLAVDAAGQSYTLSRDGDVVEKGRVGGAVGQTVGFRWTPAAAALGRDREIEFTVVSPREASVALKGRIQPLMAEEGNFITLVMTGSNPERMTRTMNTLVETFVERAAELKKANLTAMVGDLEQQQKDMGEQLRQAENALEGYRARTITKPGEATFITPPGLATTTPGAVGQFFTDKAELSQVQQDRRAIEQATAQARRGGLAVDVFAQIPTVQKSPELQAALSELAKARAELSIARDRYTDQSTQVQTIQERITRLQTQTIPALAGQVAGTLRAREGMLSGRIGSQARELQEMPARTIEEQRLTRNLETIAGLYNEVAARTQQAKLAEASAQPDVSVIDRASAPDSPVSNTAPRILIMAIAASIGLALGLAILLDKLDKRFRYPDQVTRELGLSILGAIPAIKKVRPGERDPEEAAQVVESFRTVRMNLAHSYGAAGPVLLTISSPGPGDGKSLISSNLALSFAEAGYKTILIDGDIRRGELHRMFNAERRPGLLDFLSGQADFAAVLRPTTHKNLTMIPCGTRHQHGPELLGSSAMRELMATLKSRYNVVIVDSPPLGAGIDPFVLSTATGNLMLVLRSGASDRQMAEAKLKLLDRLPVRALGAVLNDVNTDGVYKYYSYIYGYTSDEEGVAQLAGPKAE